MANAKIRPIEELVSDLRDDAQLLQSSANLLDVWWSAWEKLYPHSPRVFGTVKRCALDAAIAAAGRLFGNSGVSLPNAAAAGFEVSLELQEEIDKLSAEYNKKIMPWRHKVVAHRDLKMSAGAAAAKAQLTPENLLSFSGQTAKCVNALIAENHATQLIQKQVWMDRVDEDCSALQYETEKLIEATLRP